MAKVATDRPWLTTANHGQLVMVTLWSMMAWTVIDQDTTMTMVSIGQLLNDQLKIKNLWCLFQLEVCDPCDLNFFVMNEITAKYVNYMLAIHYHVVH